MQTLCQWVSTDLSTALMLVEEDQPSYAVNHICTVVHHNDSCGTKATLHCYKCIKVHQNIFTDSVWIMW